MRRGSGSSLARAQSGIPTGASGDGTATAGSFSFNPSGAPSSGTTTATALPSFSFSTSSPSSSSSSALPAFSFGTSSSSPFSASAPSSSSSPLFSFAPPASASPAASSSSSTPPASSFTFLGHNPQAQPQQRTAQIGPPSPYAHPAPGAGAGGPSSAAAAGAEQPWEPTFKREHKDESPFGNLLRCTTAILNKIGPRNFDSMVRELAEHVTGRCVHDGRQGVCGNGIADVQQLEMFSRVIFEKALEEPNFSDIYAHVCRAISPLCPRFDEATFEFLMSSLCDGEVVDYLEFEDEDEEDTDDEGDDGEAAAQLKQQLLERRAEFRRRLLGNLKFASELYNCGMLSTGDLLDMVDYVVDHPELCCYFMRHAGRMLDFRTDDAVEHGRVQPPYYASREEANDAKPYIDSIYVRLAKNLDDRKLPTRISFMIQDLLEERNNHWEKVPPSVPQPAAEDPPRRPPITVRRSLAGKPPGPAAAAAASAPASSPPTSRAAAAAAAASASPARTANVPTQPQSPQSPAQARAPAAPTTATTTATMESKREQVRLIAGSIVRSLKEALQWADDNERRMDAQPGLRTAARVEELNRAFLIRVSEALERMQRQHGEVPFLQNLIAVIAAYARDTAKIGGERGPYQPANIARLKGTLADRVAQVEQVINQSSSAPRPAAATAPAAAAGATTAQPPPLAAASALARPGPGPGPATGAVGAGRPPAEVQRAPAHAPAPAPAELPPDWVDPDLHQLTAGQPLDKLLRRWEEELVAKAADLDRRAKAMASFDKVYVGLDRSMAELVTNIDQVTIAQTEVDQGLDLILRHQESFYAILCDLHEEAEATLTEGDADRQRERGYDSAKEVDRGLVEVELTLKDLVEEFNSQLVQRRTTQEQKVVELEEILNNSLNALQWLSTTGSCLERKLRHLQQASTDPASLS